MVVQGWLQCRREQEGEDYQQLWFVLDDGVLSIYRDPKNSSQPLDKFNLKDAVLNEFLERPGISEIQEKTFRLRCKVSNRRLLLRALCMKDRAKWLSALTKNKLYCFLDKDEANASFTFRKDDEDQTTFRSLPRAKLNRNVSKDNRKLYRMSLMSCKSNNTSDSPLELRSTPLRELVRKSESGDMQLIWSSLPEVSNNNLIGKMTDSQVMLESLRFDYATSEVVFNSELSELVTLAKRSITWDDQLPTYTRRTISSVVEKVKKCSDSMVVDLEQAWQKKLSFNNLYILMQQNMDKFEVFVTYCNHLQELSSVLNSARNVHRSGVDTMGFSQRYNIERELLPILHLHSVCRQLRQMQALLHLNVSHLEHFHCRHTLAQLSKVLEECYRVLISTCGHSFVKSLDMRLELHYKMFNSHNISAPLAEPGLSDSVANIISPKETLETRELSHSTPVSNSEIQTESSSRPKSVIKTEKVMPINGASPDPCSLRRPSSQKKTNSNCKRKQSLTRKTGHKRDLSVAKTSSSDTEWWPPVKKDSEISSTKVFKNSDEEIYDDIASVIQKNKDLKTAITKNSETLASHSNSVNNVPKNIGNSARVSLLKNNNLDSASDKVIYETITNINQTRSEIKSLASKNRESVIIDGQQRNIELTDNGSTFQANNFYKSTSQSTSTESYDDIRKNETMTKSRTSKPTVENIYDDITNIRQIQLEMLQSSHHPTTEKSKSRNSDFDLYDDISNVRKNMAAQFVNARSKNNIPKTAPSEVTGISDANCYDDVSVDTGSDNVVDGSYNCEDIYDDISNVKRKMEHLAIVGREIDASDLPERDIYDDVTAISESKVSMNSDSAVTDDESTSSNETLHYEDIDKEKSDSSLEHIYADLTDEDEYEVLPNKIEINASDSGVGSYCDMGTVPSLNSKSFMSQPSIDLNDTEESYEKMEIVQTPQRKIPFSTGYRTFIKDQPSRTFMSYIKINFEPSESSTDDPEPNDEVIGTQTKRCSDEAAEGDYDDVDLCANRALTTTVDASKNNSLKTGEESEGSRSRRNSSLNLHNMKKWRKSLSSLQGSPMVDRKRKAKLDLPFTEAPLYQEYFNIPRNKDDGANFFIEDSNNYVQAGEPLYEVINHAPHHGRNTYQVELAEGNRRTLWSETTEVAVSGLLSQMSTQEKRLLESKFEIITSEVSFLKSLSILDTLYINSQELNRADVLLEEDRRQLFGPISQVKIASETFLHELVKVWEHDLMLQELPQIINKNASENFKVFIVYCSSQIATNLVLSKLKSRNRKFVEAVDKIELDPACQNFSLQSFLMQPMQRVTRLPILVDAIMKQLPKSDGEYKDWEDLHKTLQMVVNECNEAVRKAERNLSPRKPVETSKLKNFFNKLQRKKKENSISD